MTRSHFVFLVAATLLGTTAAAQKMPAPDGSDRVVQLHDIEPWFALATEHVDHEPDARRRATRKALDGFAAFVRAFVPEGGSTGGGVAPFADRYLTALLTAQQQAWIEVRLQGHVRAPRYQVDLAIRSFDVEPRAYAALLEPLLPDAGEHAEAPVLELQAEAANELVTSLQRHDGCVAGEVPQARIEALHSWSLESGRHLPYVKDHHVEIDNGKVESRAIHAVVFDGLRIEAVCGRLADGRCGVALEVVRSSVEQPFATFETSIGVDKKLVIDLPQITRRQYTPRLRIANGGAGVFAMRLDGDAGWQVFVVRAVIR